VPTTIQTILGKLGSYFLMKEEIAAADARVGRTDQTALAATKMARSLLGAAESLEAAAERELGAVALLKDALLFANQGVASDRKLEAGDPKATWQAVTELAEVRPLLEPISSEIRDRIERLLTSGLSIDQADWSVSEWHALKLSLTQLVRRLVQQLEDSLFESRRMRFKRLQRWVIATSVLVAIGGWQWWSNRDSGVANFALNKKVTVSSSWQAGTYPPEGLVDGDTTRIGCHTNTERFPWALIDLGRSRTIHRVVVTNRLDGLPERAVPLLVEVSADGKTFSEFARKSDVFTSWTATHSAVKGRFVRLTAMNDTVLHLNEVEVY
jgi:hypothetical protein